MKSLLIVSVTREQIFEVVAFVHNDLVGVVWVLKLLVRLLKSQILV